MVLSRWNAGVSVWSFRLTPDSPYVPPGLPFTNGIATDDDEMARRGRRRLQSETTGQDVSVVCINRSGRIVSKNGFTFASTVTGTQIHAREERLFVSERNIAARMFGIGTTSTSEGIPPTAPQGTFRKLKMRLCLRSELSPKAWLSKSFSLRMNDAFSFPSEGFTRSQYLKSDPAACRAWTLSLCLGPRRPFSALARQLWHKNVGSDGEDVAFCAEANEAHVAIAGYTTSNLYSDNNGEFSEGSVPARACYPGFFDRKARRPKTYTPPQKHTGEMYCASTSHIHVRMRMIYLITPRCSSCKRFLSSDE